MIGYSCTNSHTDYATIAAKIKEEPKSRMCRAKFKFIQEEDVNVLSKYG